MTDAKTLREFATGRLVDLWNQYAAAVREEAMLSTLPFPIGTTAGYVFGSASSADIGRAYMTESQGWIKDAQDVLRSGATGQEIDNLSASYEVTVQRRGTLGSAGYAAPALLPMIAENFKQNVKSAANLGGGLLMVAAGILILILLIK